MNLALFLRILLAQGALRSIEWALANLAGLNFRDILPWWLPKELAITVLAALLNAVADFLRGLIPQRQGRIGRLVARVF